MTWITWTLHTDTYSGQAWARAWRRLWCTRWQTCRQTKERTLRPDSSWTQNLNREESTAVLLVCMCVLSGSDCVFLRKWTAFSFSSFRMRRPRLDLIWIHHKHRNQNQSVLLVTTECVCYSDFLPTNLFQLLLLQRLGLVRQVFKLIFFLQLLLPPLDLYESSSLKLVRLRAGPPLCSCVTSHLISLPAVQSDFRKIKTFRGLKVSAC